MSEITRCNYCSLREIKKRAKVKGEKVRIKNAKDFGLGKGKDVFVNDKKVAWFAELTNHCVC